MPRIVTLQLYSDSIDKAISEIGDYQKDLKTAITRLCEALVTSGIQVVKNHIYAHGAIDIGKLMDGIDGWFDANTGIGIIKVSAWNEDYGFNYAQVVEFGSGVVGAGTSSLSKDIADPTWDYDRHGYGLAGWWYTGGHWTQGQAPRQFMWDSFQELLQKAQGIARLRYYNVPSRYSAQPQDTDKMMDLIGFID